MCFDRRCKFLYSYPGVRKDAEQTASALSSFFGRERPKIIYSDNAKEIKRACEILSYPQDTSTPHRPQSNGVCERAVRRVKEGTRCVLVQSGLSKVWWSYAMECYCFLRNTTEKCVDVNGKLITPYEVRFGQEHLEKDLFHFGCEVSYKPSSPRLVARQHTFGSSYGLAYLWDTP